MTQDKQKSSPSSKTLDTIKPILDSSLTGVMIRVDDKIIYANQKLGELTGYTTDQLIGKNIEDIFSLESAKAAREIQRQRENSEEGTIRTQLKVTHKTGSTAEIEVFTTEMLLDGQPALITHIRDLTNLKHIQHLLTQNRRLLSAVIEDQSELIIRLNPDLTIQFVNDAYCAFYGLGKADIIGSHVSAWSRPERLDRLKQQFGTLTPESPSSNLVVRTTSAADGRVHWLEWSNRALFDKNGKLFAYQNVGRDVSDRVLAEQARDKSESIKKAFYRIIPDTFALLKADGTIVDIVVNQNPIYISGMDPREFIGHNIHKIQFLPGAVTTQLQTGIHETLQSRLPYIFKFDIYVDEETGKKVFETRIFSYEGSDEVLVVFREITTEEHTKRELRDLYASQAQLFSEIAHTLKTPFSITLTSLEEINEEIKSDEVRETVQTIRKQITYANQQVTDLLKIAKLDLLPHSLDLTTLNDIDSLMQTTIAHSKLFIKNYFPDANPQDIIELEPLGQLTKITCDPQRLTDVLMMLIDNALLHSPAPNTLPKVLLKVEQDPDQKELVITIEDKGIGMPDDLVLNFSQDESTSFQFGGKYKGIGLLLCKKLITAQMGELKIVSNSSGTTCSIHLPVS